MAARNGRNPYKNSAPVALQALKLLSRFSKARRNEVRGAVGAIRKDGLNSEHIENVRNNTTEPDMLLAACLLEAPYGLRARKVSGLSQKDLWVTYDGSSKPLSLEIAYACGFLNSWKPQTEKAIGTIQLMSGMLDFDFEDGCGAVKACAEEWGASKYLCYKIALLKNIVTDENLDSRSLKVVDSLVGHDQSPAMHYSVVENILPSISIFSVARRHTNTLKSKLGSSFRSRHSLSNLVATPISEADAADFLRRSLETSLLDTAHAMWVILNLSDRFRGSIDAIRRNLDEDLFAAFEAARSEVARSKIPRIFEARKENPPDQDEVSLQMYRQSAIFLEFPDLCRFRNDLDRVVGLRLVASLLPSINSWPCEAGESIEVLKKPDGVFSLALHGEIDVKIDVFYRTYLFLRFIQEPMNLSYLTEDDIRFVFNKTSGLDSLLLESELQTMHLNASEATKPLISVLALALYRGRSSDPDIDYDYRSKLEQYILDNFDGAIPAFIGSLTTETPQIASYLATSLDEPTLEKMYKLIHSAKQASTVRRDILLAIGIALDRIDFIIEAEAIDTRNKVAKLKQYFDTSRMFVDSIAMRDWLEANPSAYTQQYKELIPKLMARLTAIARFKDEKTGESKSVPIVQISSTLDELVQQIGREAFREFCVNNEFGIESYLGRRIRHNTLHGVMINPIDAILSKQMYQPIIVSTDFGRALRGWESSFRNYIERMRKEFLQFSSKGKPNALFDPEIDLSDTTTKRGMAQLSNSIQVSGTEMLSDLIISYCWQQIGPQLDIASRRIKVQMAREVKHALEAAIGKFQGLEERKIFSELNHEIDDVFSKVASWFRRPETGFVPATLKDICRIVDIEAGRDENLTIVRGNALDTEYYGISVHRLYDCLAVLIQNAVKHGEFHSQIQLNCETSEISNTNLHTVRISVLSTVDAEEITEKIGEIERALSSTESAKDMVNEGFSGLKKLKYITKITEGEHTVEVSNYGNQVELRFSLKAEVSSSEGEHEADSTG